MDMNNQGLLHTLNSQPYTFCTTANTWKDSPNLKKFFEATFHYRVSIPVETAVLVLQVENVQSALQSLAPRKGSVRYMRTGFWDDTHKFYEYAFYFVPEEDTVTKEGCRMELRKETAIWTNARIVLTYSECEEFWDGVCAILVTGTWGEVRELITDLMFAIHEDIEYVCVSPRTYMLWVDNGSNEKDISILRAQFDEGQPAATEDLYSEDLDTHTNEHGGSQSSIPGRFDLLPADAIAEVAAVLKHGADKYQPNNWRLIPLDDHVNHALRHVFGFLKSGDKEDLSHAACRLLFALDMYGKEIK